MDLILKDIQNNIGEIELGDIIYFPGETSHYYMIMIDSETKFYYLKDLNGRNSLGQYDKHATLKSLRQALMSMFSIEFIHYPAKEYRLELVKKPNIGGNN